MMRELYFCLIDDQIKLMEANRPMFNKFWTSTVQIYQKLWLFYLLVVIE